LLLTALHIELDIPFLDPLRNSGDKTALHDDDDDCDNDDAAGCDEHSAASLCCEDVAVAASAVESGVVCNLADVAAAGAAARGPTEYDRVTDSSCRGSAGGGVGISTAESSSLSVEQPLTLEAST
jgi:hypothetical protein